MKISKLFHWLYAFIMLLPVFFVLGKIIYTSFNQNAKDSFYGETINEDLRVNIPYTDLKAYNTYYLQAQIISSEDTYTLSDFSIQNCKDITSNTDYSMYSKLRLFKSGSSVYLQLSETGLSSVTITNRDVLQFDYISNTNGSILGVVDFWYLEYNRYSYLDNSLAYAMSEINEVNIFSWAKDSFLVAPFTYITGLFGIAANSPITTLLSYWLAISIIWLVFDLIMYVPLLVHRWLDKGVLE